jgi:nucleoside-diphosphate-sugar epimerase
LIYGDGNQSRDFIYVKDVVKANLLAASEKKLGGKVFNIGTGNSVSIKRLWELISSFSGRRLDPSYEPARSGDILHSLAGIDLATSRLKFKYDFPLEKGLEMTFEWYRGQVTEDRSI